jgi:hypothetical protein
VAARPAVAAAAFTPVAPDLVAAAVTWVAPDLVAAAFAPVVSDPEDSVAAAAAPVVPDPEDSAAWAAASAARAAATSSRAWVWSTRARRAPARTFAPTLTYTFFTVPEVVKARSRLSALVTFPDAPAVAVTSPWATVA